MKNLFDDLDPHAAEEDFRVLLKQPGWTLERIVSTGQSTTKEDWYDQAQHEWVVLLSGHAQLLFKDPAETFNMMPGDWLNIPAHRRHRVEATSTQEPSVWLALHYDASENPSL